MKPIFDPIYGDLFTAPDFLSSRTTTGGATITFTSDATDSFLQHSKGRLIFNDSGGTSRFRIYGNENGQTPGISTQGCLWVGRGYSLFGVNPAPGQSNTLFGIADSMANFAWRTAAAWNPAMDADIGGNTLTLANFAGAINNPFESTDGGNLEAHWDEANDGAVGDAAHAVTTTSFIAQTFTVGANPVRAFDLSVRAYRTGNPGTAIAKVYAVDGANKPTGAAIATSTALDVSAISTSSVFGEVLVASLADGGTGYTVNDVLTIAIGDMLATVRVDSVSGGTITAITLLTGGSGYSIGVWGVTGGTGVDAFINVDAIGPGGWIAMSFSPSLFYFGNLSAATRYALRIEVTGGGTLTVISDESSGGFPGQFGWTSIDSGATWTEIPPGGSVGTFLFTFNAYHGLGATLYGSNYQLTGSTSGGAMLGWFTEVSLLKIQTNITLTTGSKAWTDFNGISISILSVGGGTAPTRSAAIRLSTGGNGTTSWGLITQARMQLTTTIQLIFGGTGTTVGVNYMSRGGTAEIIMGLSALTNTHYRWTATAFRPEFTIRTQDLGGATNKGWKGLFLQDTAAAFTTYVQATSAGIAANNTLIIDMETASIITLHPAWLGQDVDPDRIVTFNGLILGSGGLKLLDVVGGFYLIPTPSTLSADRTFIIDITDADRTLKLTGNPTLADWFDQSVKTTGTPQFARLGLGTAADGTALLKLAAGNVLLDTTTGTAWGTTNTEKQSWWGAAPVVQNTGWSVTNEASDKSFDADATSLDEIADVLATVVETLKTYGLLGA